MESFQILQFCYFRERKANDGQSFLTWAPEKLSILSWNLDGLDDKNLEKRTEHVVSIIEK